MAVDIELGITALNNAIQQGLQKTGLILERTAKENCPVDTGQLKSSIVSEVEDKTVYVGTDVEYAPYVEIGTGIYSSEGTGRKTKWYYEDTKGEWHETSGQHPHPFLKPALEKNKGRIEQEFKGLI